MGRPSGEDVREERVRRRGCELASHTRDTSSSVGLDHGKARERVRRRGRWKAMSVGHPAAVTGPKEPRRAQSRAVPRSHLRLRAISLQRGWREAKREPYGGRNPSDVWKSP